MNLLNSLIRSNTSSFIGFKSIKHLAKLMNGNNASRYYVTNSKHKSESVSVHVLNNQTTLSLYL